jgi:hypothetical protein
MPVLDLRGLGLDDMDEHDTVHTWEEYAALQGPGNTYGEVTQENLQESDCWAFYTAFDGEGLRQAFIFVVDEDAVLVTDEHGARIDAPTSHVTNGVTSIGGENGFHARWAEGFFEPAYGEPPAEDDDDNGREGVHDNSGREGVRPSDFTPGVRFQECLRMDEHDSAGKWFGGVFGDSLPDKRAVMGFDDGELLLMSPEEVKGITEMGKLCLCTVTGGLVADEPRPLRAVAVSYMKCQREFVPVGVFLDTQSQASTIGGVPFYSDHVVATGAVAQALESSYSRPTRAKSRTSQEDARAGYKTIRRGDILLYTGDDAIGSTMEEVAFGVLNAWSGLSKPQHNRFIISYDASLEKFSVCCWTSWRRLPATPADGTSFDPDLSDVKRASDEQIATMLAAWEEEKELRTVKNISTLRKLPSKVTLSATDPECCC